MQSVQNISEEFALLFRDGAKVYAETSDFLIGLKKEQRIEFRKLVLAKVTQAHWKVLSDEKDNPYKHHFLLQVKNAQFDKMLQAAQDQMEEEDFMDLSGL